MNAKHPWFQSFVETIATRIMVTVNWGTKARVYGIAVLSTVDMASDLVVSVDCT
jgi:hypothetical protein